MLISCGVSLCSNRIVFGIFFIDFWRIIRSWVGLLINTICVRGYVWQISFCGSGHVDSCTGHGMIVGFVFSFFPHRFLLSLLLFYWGYDGISVRFPTYRPYDFYRSICGITVVFVDFLGTFLYWRYFLSISRLFWTFNFCFFPGFGLFFTRLSAILPSFILW